MLPTGILICCTGPFWRDSLCLFGFCLPSLRCLISALTQAGGGDLLFRFTSSVQSCCGEGGALQTDFAVCGEHSLCSATLGLPRTGVSVLSPSTVLRLPALYRECALHCLQFQFLSTWQERGFGCACVLCLPRPKWLRQPGAWRAHSPRVWRSLSPPRPQPQFLRVLVGGQQLVFVLRIWPLVATLPALIDHPESQGVFG